jgi:hypothetical protein
VEGFLARCQVGQRAAFFLLIAVAEEKDRATDVLSLPAITVVESGGRTESGLTLHAFWRFYAPATEAGIETVHRIG